MFDKQGLVSVIKEKERWEKRTVVEVLEKSPAEESNQRYKYLLEQGQTGLSVAFDLPTKLDTIPTIL